MNDVEVSVVVLTYYHEKYLKQAIESILAQKTTFRYEIIISDDASQDGTVKIIQEYADKYPNLIRYIVHDTNVGISKNMFLARCEAKGKYISQVSGDDYLLSCDKLQRQYDFLESNDKVIGVTTTIESRYNDEQKAIDYYPQKTFRSKCFKLKDFLNGYDIPTHGMMIRNLYLEEKDRTYMSVMPKASRFIDDFTDMLLLLNKGDFFVLGSVDYAYRMIKSTEAKNYNSQKTFLKDFERHIAMFNSLYDTFNGKFDLRKRYMSRTAIGIIGLIQEKDRHRFSSIYNSIPLSYRKPWYRFYFLGSVFEVGIFLSKALSRRIRHQFKVS